MSDLSQDQLLELIEQDKRKRERECMKELQPLINELQKKFNCIIGPNVNISDRGITTAIIATAR